MRRDNRAEKVHKKRRRRKKRYLLRFLLLILLCVGIYFGVHIDYFKVDGIAVVGNEEISDEEILKLSELEVGENIFDVHPLFAQHRTLSRQKNSSTAARSANCSLWKPSMHMITQKLICRGVLTRCVMGSLAEAAMRSIWPAGLPATRRRFSPTRTTRCCQTIRPTTAPSPL